MVRPQADDALIDSATTDRRRRGACSTASRSTVAVASATEGQASCRADPSRLGACRRELSRLLDVVGRPRRRAQRDRRTARSCRRPIASMSCAYQYGVETTAQPAAIAEGERPRRDLLAVPVRSHEDVGRGKQVGDLVDAEEAVVELDVLLEAEVEHRLLERQPIPLALAVRDVRMRAAGDHVERPRDAAPRSRAARRSPSPGPCRPRSARTSRARNRSVRVVRSRIGAPCLRLASAHVRRRVARARRRAVRDDANLLLRARAAVDEQPPRGVGHHDHELGLAAHRREHLRLMRRRLRQDRVQRHDERLRQLLDERERRSRRRGRRRSRTRAGAARRRRRAGRGSGPRARSRRAPPARSSP